MDNGRCITVTHFINPHLFWYKDIRVPDENNKKLSIFEQSLEELYRCESYYHLLQPQIGDKIAVHLMNWNKFVRAEVLRSAEFQKEEYIVWATDYGFPLLTKKEYLRNLPSNLCDNIGIIKIGGIANIYPAEQEYDCEEGNLVMVKKEKWLQKICNMLEKLLADAASIRFVKEFHSANDHQWGDLIIINHKGVQISARDFLLQTTSAIVENNTMVFHDVCSKLETINVAPWLSNNHNAKVEFNTIRHNYIENSKLITETLTDKLAKRKVENWQKRNERDFSQHLESNNELIEENVIDKVTCDNSVPVENNLQVNYIGKAGAFAKIKKFSSVKEWPASILSKSFEIYDMLDFKCLSETDALTETLDPPFFNKQNVVEHTVTDTNGQYKLPLLDFISETTSTVSYGIVRKQKLTQMRRKTANEKKYNGKNCQTKQRLAHVSTGLHEEQSLNECKNTTMDQSDVCESYPCQLHEQLSDLSSLTTTIENFENNKHEISAEKFRAMHLIAKRKKIGLSSLTTINNKCRDEIFNDSQLSMIDRQCMDGINKTNQQGNIDKDLSQIDHFNFKLKSKMISNSENNVTHLKDKSLTPPMERSLVNEKAKICHSGYDEFTMIPAGYDLTRLQIYKDEENHWHRKKTTRSDCKTLSAKGFLPNNQNLMFSDLSEKQLHKELPRVSSNNVNIDRNSCNSLSSLSEDKLQNEVKRMEQLPVIAGERNIQTKFIDHLVLAHSSVQLTPIDSISEAPFLPEIHAELRQMHINNVYRLQVYSWSHVLRNNSLFVVNPSKSGKTWSFLPSLCSLLCCRKDTLKSSYGPMAIILVASMKHVELINSYCSRLMSGLKGEAPTCVPSYGIRNLIETKVQLLNGCGILVATPSGVLRLLQENKNDPLFDTERLQHIVIDDMDLMMSRAQQDFECVLRTIFNISNKSKFKTIVPQLIVTSRNWDGLMIKLIQKSNQPLLLIGDFLEAAVYGHANLSIQLKSSTEKNEAILKYIKKVSKSDQNLNNRILIICTDDEDVQNVIKFLQEYGYLCLGYCNCSTENEHIAVEEWKKKVSSQILVCTDARFYEIKVRNVNILIHYSMPSSWTRFATRFSALACAYTNYVSSNFKVLPPKSNEHTVYSMILLDENNSLQLPRLVNFMRKYSQKVQNEILEVSKGILIMREEQKILNGSLLCPQFLEFSECDEIFCAHRHQLTRFDFINKSDNIPCNGEIRIHILKIFSPTHYAVRLLHHRIPGTTKWLEVRHSSEALRFFLQLDMYYRNENNLSLHWPPRANDLCIYQYAENFKRARIIDAPILQKMCTNVIQPNLNITLKLIDDGIIINSVKCNEIFVCEDKFKNFPPQSIDVRLMHIVPFDNERTWDSKTIKQVQKWIIDDIKSNYIVQASIDFALANTIWVKNLVVMEKLSCINAYCQIVNLKKSLLEKNFGVLYKGNRKHIRDLAKECGLLNALDLELENDDSDPDYQLCAKDSTNVRKYPLSNKASLESVETGLGKPVMEMQQTSDMNKSRITTIDTELIATNTYNDKGNLHVVSVPVSLDMSPEYKKVNVKFYSEMWSQLPLNEVVKVEIGDEEENGNWENIFLQIIDKNSIQLFDELNKLIIKHIENIKSSTNKQKEIYNFERFQNCLVKYKNQYFRAKVCGIYGEKVEQRLYNFFLCDYACFIKAKTEDMYNDFIYETTEEIVNFTPYQAVHCTLYGIKWNCFKTKYQVTKDYLYACAISESEQNSLLLSNLHINSYKVLLYECEHEDDFRSAQLFNKVLLDNDNTLGDEESENFQKYGINCKVTTQNESSDKVEEIVDNKDELLTFEQLLNSIKSGAFDVEIEDILNNKQERNDIKTIAKCGDANKELTKCNLDTSDSCANTKALKEITPVPISTIDKQDQHTSDLNSVTTSTPLVSLTVLCPPPLKMLYKRPLTTWYENEYMIFLSIYAPDIKEYLLEISSKSILLVTKYQGEKYVLLLNLLGSIDTQSVSHELRGLNIIIRLKKQVFEKWPRLLQESIKYSWLKFNFNSFDSEEMQSVMPQQRLYTILDNDLCFNRDQIDNYSSEEDSEHELYKTYNPIQNNDDHYDQFS